jgi:glycosyltransferase involved in cell wall biosynthesis
MQSTSPRPRLLFVMAMIPTKIGGLEQFLRALTVRLDAAGWDTILCFDGVISAEFQQYFDLPFVTLEVVHGQEGIGLGARRQLWSLLRRHRPQIFVYAFNSVLRIFPWIARLAGCRRIFFNDHSSRAQGVVPAPLALHKRLISRLLTSPLTGIVSVSNFTRRSGKAYGLCTAPNIVVPNGIEVQPFDEARRTEFRSRYGIAPEALVVTQVCWMTQVKGVDVLLSAAKTLLRDHPSLRFLMVGGGDKLNDYRALAQQLGIAEGVLFTGIISDPVGAGVFAATDIYCQASLWQEASGLAVLEAMSMRRPVVASDTGGLPENVLRDRTGLLVTPNNSEELAQAIDRLVRAPDLRRSMGDAGREEVLQNHQVHNTVNRYVELLLQYDWSAAESSR